MKPDQAAERLVQEISDGLAEIWATGGTARYVIVAPTDESWGALIAHHHNLDLVVTPDCAPGKIYLMANPPVSELPL